MARMIQVTVKLAPPYKYWRSHRIAGAGLRSGSDKTPLRCYGMDWNEMPRPRVRQAIAR
jgi:hypothetical protein